jgi:hypothetical protein
LRTSCPCAADQRSTRGERRDEPGRNEEVRVHDIRVKAPSGANRIPEQASVSSGPSRPTIDDRTLDLVATRDELLLEVGDEDAEIRVVGTRVHLRDEEDPHRRVNRDVFGALALLLPNPQWLPSDRERG